MKNIISGLAVLLLLGFSILKFGMRANNLSRSNQAINAQKERERMMRKVQNDIQNVNRQLMATNWIGVINANNKDYLTEIQFINANSGRRIIYLTKDGKEGCFIKQDFNWNTGGHYNSISKTNPITINTGMFNFSSSTCQSSFKNEIEAIGKISLNRLNVNKNYQTSAIQLEGFTRQEKSNIISSNSKTVSKVNTKELIAYRNIEKELLQKFEEKPGGLSSPQFSISGDMAEITVNVFGKNEPLGNIVLEKDKYLFMTNYWQPTNHFSWAGTWKDIRYLDRDGNEKVGDLKFCFSATRKPEWSFKEVNPR